MAYKRRNYGRRRSYKKKSGWLQTGMSVARKAGKALALAGKVASIVNAESFHFDTDAAPTPDNATGYVQVVNNPAQGDGDGQRTGDSIKMKSLQVRTTFYRSASSTLSGTQVRCLVFIWNQPTSTPTLADILETVTIDSPKNYDKRYMSKVLYDRVIELNGGSGGTAHSNFYVKFVGKLAKRAHVMFATGTTNVNNNGVYVAFLSNEATNTPICNFYARTVYHDN